MPQTIETLFGSTKKTKMALIGRRGQVLLASARAADVPPKPQGGSVSPLEEHGEFLFALIDEQPGLTRHTAVRLLARTRSKRRRWPMVTLGDLLLVEVIPRLARFSGFFESEGGSLFSICSRQGDP